MELYSFHELMKILSNRESLLPKKAPIPNWFLNCLFSVFHFLAEFCLETEFLQFSNKTSVNISSPLFPVPYPNDIHCTWRISNANDMFIVLTFWEVELTRSDGIHITIGSELKSQHTIMELNEANGHPNTIIVNSTDSWIFFESGLDGRAKGFFFQIENVETYGKISSLH